MSAVPLFLEFPASERWARAIVRAVSAAKDFRTLGDLARQIGTSRGALRNWCYVAGIRPRAALDFARLLRAAYNASVTCNGGHGPLALLDAVDQRTLHRMLGRGGLCVNEAARQLDCPATFLRLQRFVSVPDALAAVRRALEITAIDAESGRAEATSNCRPSRRTQSATGLQP
jgi:hypothetical protein